MARALLSPAGVDVANQLLLSLLHAAPPAPRVAKAPPSGGGSPSPDPRAKTSLHAPWYRHDWATVVLGLLAIGTVIYFVAEGIRIGTGLRPTDRATAWFYDGRGLAAMISTALWVGFRAHRAEQKLAVVRERARRDEVALAEERWRAEQADGLGAFSRALAHELRNPLHALSLHGTVVKRLAEHVPASEGQRLRDAAVVLHEQSERMGALLDDYLAYGQAADPHFAPRSLALDAVAADVVAASREAFDERGLRLHLRCDARLPRIQGDPARLEQAIHHVVHHALDGLPRGGHVDLALDAEGGHVVLRVTDDGPGFADPDAVFRPFYLTGNRGAGLAFAVVRDIVRAHRGEVLARNVGPGGAQVEIRLPAGDTR